MVLGVQAPGADSRILELRGKGNLLSTTGAVFEDGQTQCWKSMMSYALPTLLAMGVVSNLMADTSELEQDSRGEICEHFCQSDTGQLPFSLQLLRKRFCWSCPKQRIYQRCFFLPGSLSNQYSGHCQNKDYEASATRRWCRVKSPVHLGHILKSRLSSEMSFSLHVSRALMSKIS